MNMQCRFQMCCCYYAECTQIPSFQPKTLNYSRFSHFLTVSMRLNASPKKKKSEIYKFKNGFLYSNQLSFSRLAIIICSRNQASLCINKHKTKFLVLRIFTRSPWIYNTQRKQRQFSIFLL